MNEFNTKILCPVCNFDYVHFNRPEYNSSDDVSGKAWAGRGDAVIIPMWCEDNHKWNLIIGHHKGSSFVYCELPKEVINFNTIDNG